MKLTFNDEASGTSITTTPDRLQLGNTPDGVILMFGGFSLLTFKGITVQAIPAAPAAPAPDAPLTKIKCPS